MEKWMEKWNEMESFFIVQEVWVFADSGLIFTYIWQITEHI